MKYAGAECRTVDSLGSRKMSGMNVKDSLNESEIKSELGYLGKSLAALKNAVDSLQQKTTSVTRPEQESDLGGGPIQTRYTELGINLQNFNQIIQQETSRIFSVNDRIEL